MKYSFFSLLAQRESAKQIARSICAFFPLWAQIAHSSRLCTAPPSKLARQLQFGPTVPFFWLSGWMNMVGGSEAPLMPILLTERGGKHSGRTSSVPCC